MKKYKTEIELYVNDKLWKTVSEDKWNSTFIQLTHILRMKNYHEQYDDLPGFEYPSSYVHVWINWDKKKIVVLSHKERTQFKDNNGNVLYVDDIVDYNDLSHPIQSYFSAKPFNEGYYIREVFHHPGGDSWADTNIDETNIAYITKVKDVLDFPKQYWNSPEIFNIDTL